VLLDVDTGTDDALALLLLLAADAVGEVKLLGISCVAGNTTLDNVCRNTLRILRAANRLDVSTLPSPTRSVSVEFKMTTILSNIFIFYDSGGEKARVSQCVSKTASHQIPVFAGAEAPLISERPIRNTYHGQDGFGDLQHQNDAGLEGLLQEENAVVALNRIVSANKGTKLDADWYLTGKVASRSRGEACCCFCCCR
jgi:inosine-uridine nucleoside N-ribohydrolase